MLEGEAAAEAGGDSDAGRDDADADEDGSASAPPAATAAVAACSACSWRSRSMRAVFIRSASSLFSPYHSTKSSMSTGQASLGSARNHPPAPRRQSTARTRSIHKPPRFLLDHRPGSGRRLAAPHAP
jgi:hypothetical protein